MSYVGIAPLGSVEALGLKDCYILKGKTMKFWFSKISLVAFVVVAQFIVTDFVSAQDQLPYDNGLATYHTAPRYRESESHPLRIVAYALHPIGWALREGVFRPLDGATIRSQLAD